MKAESTEVTERNTPNWQTHEWDSARPVCSRCGATDMEIVQSDAPCPLVQREMAMRRVACTECM